MSTKQIAKNQVLFKKILAYTSCLVYSRTDDSEYNAIFCQLIKGVIERCSGGEREELLRRLYLESPIITEDAIDILKQFVTMREQTTAITGVTNNTTKCFTSSVSPELAP